MTQAITDGYTTRLGLTVPEPYPVLTPVEPSTYRDYYAVSTQDLDEVVGATTSEPPLQSLINVDALVGPIYTEDEFIEASTIGTFPSLPLVMGVTPTRQISVLRNSDMDLALAGFPTFVVSDD